MAMCWLGVPGLVAGSVPSFSSRDQGWLLGLAAGFGCHRALLYILGLLLKLSHGAFQPCLQLQLGEFPSCPRERGAGSQDDIINRVYKVTACRS